jgi:hypothetical protein
MAFLLMSAALAAGAGCALLVFLVLKMRKRTSWRACTVAALFPPAVMAYVLGCLVVSSALSGVLGTPDLVFGDLHERLPNGYTIEALDKMPECGHIEKAGSSTIEIAWVRSLQVESPYVFGKYDYTYFPKTAEEAQRNYFSFNTRAGGIRDFASEKELAAAASTNIHLTPTPNFRGVESPLQRITSLLFILVTFVLPLFAGLWLTTQFARSLRIA